ncbi:MAG TPA: hypothetical protein PLR74_17805, partial [Agriterribacter sp.]|nr:hypothetical protein [Agriterribacter sp.]
MNTVYSGSDHKRLADDLFHQGIRYKNTGSDSLLWYANRLILLGEERVDDRVIINGMLLKANYEWRTGNHIAAMNVAMNALQKAEDNKFTEVVPVLYGIIGNLHKENENYPLALQAAEQGIRAAILIKDTTELIRIM